MRSLAKISFFICVLVIIQSCDSLLERTSPSTSVSQEVALEDADAVKGIRARMYSRLHAAPDMNTTWLLGPSALADNTDIRPGRGRFQGLNDNDFRAGVGTAAYNNLYDLINDANLLISGVQEGVLPDDQLSMFRGEGLFMRALALHHLVRIFGYEPGMAPKDFNLGVVIRTEPTLEAGDADNKERSTVDEVYSQIVQDLNDAVSALSVSQDEGPFYITQAAAQALLARVHLYQQNYGEANNLAEAAINNSGARLAEPSEVATMFDETVGNPEAIFTVDVDPTTESGGINDGLAAYTSMQWMAQIPTQDLISLYEAGDVRRDAWYSPCLNDVTGEAPGGCSDVNDDGLELRKYSAEQGQFADDYIHFRVSEMKLIQAEARANEDGAVTTRSLDPLNELRVTRDASTFTTADFAGVDEFIDEILDERRRELAAEGHRFFDLKRLGRDLRKVTPEGDVSFIPYSDTKILDDIPPAQLEVNPKLQQNPGYQ